MTLIYKIQKVNISLLKHEYVIPLVDIQQSCVAF
mgnify:FL=1